MKVLKAEMWPVGFQAEPEVSVDLVQVDEAEMVGRNVRWNIMCRGDVPLPAGAYYRLDNEFVVALEGDVYDADGNLAGRYTPSSKHAYHAVRPKGEPWIEQETARDLLEAAEALAPYIDAGESGPDGFTVVFPPRVDPFAMKRAAAKATA